MPLTGKSILVTSAGNKGEDFAAKLRSLGAQALLLPMIEINDPDSWEQLDKALTNLHSYNWLFFASSTAVTAFVKRLNHNHGRTLEPMGLDHAQSVNVNLENMASANTNAENAVLPASMISKLPAVAVIGQKTAETAISYGIVPKYCPSNYLAEDFIGQFPGYANDLAGTNILWPRTNIGRDFILEKLLAAKANVDIVPAYKTDFPSKSAELSELLQIFIGNKEAHESIESISSREPDANNEFVSNKEANAGSEKKEKTNIKAITIGSKQTALNLAKILCQELSPNDISRNLLSASFPTPEDVLYLQKHLADILIVTIGPEASAGALNYLGKVNLEAKPHTVDGMINALIEYYRRC